MSEKKYLLIWDWADPSNFFCEVFDTLKEANAAARKAWGLLAEYGRKRLHLYVGEVTREGLDTEAIDEETGEVDWRLWHHCATPAGAFDSDEIARGGENLNPLKHYRQMATLSQKELAEKAGISPRTLQDYEQGRKRLAAASYETVVALARILEVEPQELCPEV